MKIIETYIVMMVKNAPSTLFKLHKLEDGTFVKEVNCGNFIEIVSTELAEMYIYNFNSYYTK